MRLSRLFSLTLASLIGLTILTVERAWACDRQTPCDLAEGRYYAALPEKWDGRTPLRLAMYFHGYRGNGKAAIEGPVAQAFLDQGFLVIAPEGLEGSWSHQGSPRQGRDEVPFVAQVLRDAEQRWPIDPKRRVATGFSQGGSMVWHLACFMPEAFTAFAPAAGAFWRPHPAVCPAAPVNLRHIHGTEDKTVPMTGRPIGSAFHQGDVRDGIYQWLGFDGCSLAVDVSSRDGALTCDIWRRCASGKEVGLCLHDGGHVYTADWVPGIVAWLQGLPDWGG